MYGFSAVASHISTKPYIPLGRSTYSNLRYLINTTVQLIPSGLYSYQVVGLRTPTKWYVRFSATGLTAVRTVLCMDLVFHQRLLKAKVVRGRVNYNYKCLFKARWYSSILLNQLLVQREE